MYFDVKMCGRRIQLLRSQKHLTQLQMSFKVNVSEKHLAAIEQGTKAASLDVLIEFAEFFGVSLDYLVLGKSDQEKTVRLIHELESIERHMERIRGLL